jgi:N-acyl-phosphatidylethanolamine-hydrolysing phospholipase D
MRAGKFDRREFIKTGLTLGKWGAVFGLLPVSAACGRSGTDMGSMEIGRKAAQLTLTEIAERKLHHGRDLFLNPFSTRDHGNMWRVLRWKLFDRNRFKSFYKDEPTVPVKIDWDLLDEKNGCSVTFIRHSCVLICDLESSLLVDPVLFGLMWFTDFSPLAFDVKRMPRPDHILITHGHYDHLDKSSLKIFPPDTHVISPLGYDSIFKDLGMQNRSQLDWFDGHKEGKREIILLPCNHWTMRNPLVGPNRALWGSFLVKGASGFNVFISGDTAYFDRFKEIGKTFPIDLAIFNLGAYEPRWFMASSHLNPAETVKAFMELNAKKLMIVHWGTFRLGDEPVHFPPLDIKREMKRQGLLDRLVHLNHGETYRLG